MQNTRFLVKFAALAVALFNITACDLISGSGPDEKPAESEEKRVSASDPADREDSQEPQAEQVKHDPIPEGYLPGFDFVDNRAAALLYGGGGLVIPCGCPGFAKYIEGGWKNPWILNREVKVEEEHLLKEAPQISRAGKYPAALISGRSGSLVFPLYWSESGVGRDSKQDLVIEILMFTSMANQHLTPMVNGTSLQSVRLRQGVNLVRLPVANHLVKRGDNMLRMVFSRSGVEHGVPSMGKIITGMGRRRPAVNSRSAAALFAVGIGGKDYTLPQTDAIFESRFRKLSEDEPEIKKLVLNKREKISYFVLPPQETMLVFEFSKTEASGGEDSKKRPRFLVKAESDEDEETILMNEKAVDGRRRKVIDLSPYAGRATRLDFVSPDGAVELSNISLHAKLQRPPATWEEKEIRFVFIWMADTLRRDAVGAYGAKDAHTPNFDRFARRSVVFEQATIQGNHSMTSHGALLTGLYPPVHGFETAKRRLTCPLIYEYMHKAGWVTGIFSSNGYVSDRWGFHRGLDVYRNFIRENAANASRFLWGAAGRFLKRHLDDKVFLYLATIDPHVTYDPPSDLLKLHYPEPYHGPVPRRATGLYLERLVTGAIRLDDPRDRKRFKALYKGEVSYNDLWFGNFLNDLEEMGIADKSLIVLVSDHGDQFWEHGSVGHGRSLYEEEVAVPFMMWWPGLPDEEIRVEGDVDAMDMYATILDLVGLLDKAPSQSKSLLDRIRGEKPTIMPAAFSFNYMRDRSARMDRYKFITRRPEEPALFDLSVDPTEQKNIASTTPIALRLMRNTFSIKNAYLPRWSKSEWGRASNLKPVFYRAVKDQEDQRWGPRN